MANPMKDRLVKILGNTFIKQHGISKVESTADYLLANGATVPVRCKDCKYFTVDTFKQTMCNRTFTMFEMKPDDYCSYGERKDAE